MPLFQSTLPAGEATVNTFTVWNLRDFNPRFPRGKRLKHEALTGKIAISIHASRGGSDWQEVYPCCGQPISIHASRGGSDLKQRTNWNLSTFQSTLPAGEATEYQDSFLCLWYFNPRFPRGKRQPVGEALGRSFNFNPRFPRGKRLIPLAKDVSCKEISIHASRGGSDARSLTLIQSVNVFQSTLPAGEATGCPPAELCPSQFQSTLPAGEATISIWAHGIVHSISIHASRGGSDQCDFRRAFRVTDFNPRFPRGKRPMTGYIAHLGRKISIHASRGGSDGPLLGGVNG